MEEQMLNKLLSVVVLSVVAAGCGVKAQTYVMTKERSDISESGNAGYLGGTPKYQEPERKTRKVYIFEVSKPAREAEVKKIQEETTTRTTEVGSTEAGNHGTVTTSVNNDVAEESSRKIVIPRIDDEPTGGDAQESPATGPVEAVTYTVQKDDTLQKIAKKFYDSYGKWTKIYEANKEKIKNPNFVKPGTVLTIPAAK
jgi:nucleoid-associated protein YgaU